MLVSLLIAALIVREIGAFAIVCAPRKPSLSLESTPLPSAPAADIATQQIVLIAGFESFNRQLYTEASRDLDLNVTVFCDADLRIPLFGKDATSTPWKINPAVEQAIAQADVVLGSLIFDYDDVAAVTRALDSVMAAKDQKRLIFESATELMEYNRVGSFNMMPKEGAEAGPPPAVKAILSKFSSGKEEDKLSAYLKLLKVGPDLLQFVPGTGDLQTWLSAYRYWNQGGPANVRAMLQLLSNPSSPLPPVTITPDVGLVHPMAEPSATGYFAGSPASYLRWRLSEQRQQQSEFPWADAQSAPRVAILLYRKHVITGLRYINDLIRMMEEAGVLPIPIFINGVEAHTIVRDLLTSRDETRFVNDGTVKRESTYQHNNAVTVDAIVNTIGFPLVGGPAGSMQAGRNTAVAEELLSSMNVPYFVAGPLLLQSIQQWKQSGVTGLQSVVLYALPELDGAIDTVVLGGLVGDPVALIPERVRKLASRVKGWHRLRQTPAPARKIAIAVYGFPPNVGAVGTAALLDVPRSLDQILRRLDQEGYDLGGWQCDGVSNSETLVAALAVLSENSVISGGADGMVGRLEAKIQRAIAGDTSVAASLAAGLGTAKVKARNVSASELEQLLGKFMYKKVERAWGSELGPGVSAANEYVVAGIEIGNIWLFVQPLLGVEGDPMRMLFQRDLTPHPQYCSTYEWMKQEWGAQAVIHLG